MSRRPLLIAVLVASALAACEVGPRRSTAGPVVVGGAPAAEPGSILPGQTGAELLAALDRGYSPARTLGYGRARDALYAREQEVGAALCGVYSAYCVQLPPGDPSREAGRLGINAEHVWPQSMGARAEPFRSDLHHLFPAREQVNSARGNLPFGEVDDERATAWYAGAESQSRPPDGLRDGWAERGQGRFEPPEARKGDVARATFYAVAVYPELAEAAFFRTMRETLLGWHRRDPADAAERARSAWVASLQGTDNPFVLDASLADRAFGDGDFRPSTGAPPSPAPAPPPDPRRGERAARGDLWINEVHYDNAGEDVGEGVEVAGPDGAALDGWLLVAVNGNGGAVVETVALSGALVGDGLGAEWVPMPGLQNGSPDGVALVAPGGRVAEALSWEGPMTGADGPVAGVRFADIGVAESPSAAVGTSLQRVGQGRRGADFRWIGGEAATPGWINAGQRAR